jgi:hypothetical protein
MMAMPAALAGILLILAQAPPAKIVGVGASTCARFNQDIGEAPARERDYLAWAQGFMSGALIRAPEGIDEGLDLAPSSMPLNAQADFLRAFCRKSPDLDYMDAVHALYRQLRTRQTL